MFHNIRQMYLSIKVKIMYMLMIPAMFDFATKTRL